MKSNIDLSSIKSSQVDHLPIISQPELNQAILNLLVENQAGIPLYMKPASGNSNDKEGFNTIIKEHLNSFKSAQNNPYFIMDAAGYTQDNLMYFHQQNRYLISRIPQTIKEAKELLQSIDIGQMEALSKGYKGQWHDSNYADVSQLEQLYRHTNQLQKQADKQVSVVPVLAVLPMENQCLIVLVILSGSIVDGFRCGRR